MMSANASTAPVAAPSRPPVVDYAVYALIARCIFSIAAAFALYGARDEVTRSLADAHQKAVDAHKSQPWSAAVLHHNVNLWLRDNVVVALVMAVLIAIVIKLVRDGRNWARVLYLVFAILVTRDVFQVLGFFQYDDFLTRLLTGLVGLSSIAALVLLYLPESNAYFRPARAGGGLMGGLFRPRGVPRGIGMAGGQPSPGTRPAGPGSVDARTAEPVPPSSAAEVPRSPAEAMPASSAEAVRPSSAEALASADASSGARRSAPRGKSRQTGQPKREGRR
jgi:hypothetical protein